jgi:Protein of unknown function (DUF4231)
VAQDDVMTSEDEAASLETHSGASATVDTSRSAGSGNRTGGRGPAWERLEDQVSWYDRRSTSNKRLFMSLKILQLVAAAAVPVLASTHAAVWVIGGLGAAVVVVEGIQQLGQFQTNWINYRSTAEALKHEKYLYLASAGPYHSPGKPERILAERIEGLISQEHAKWTSAREERTDEDQPRPAATGPAHAGRN